MPRLRNIALVIALVLGGGLLHAQPADEPDASGDQVPEVDLPMQKQAQLSPKEMAKKSDSLIEEMKGMLKRVLQLQQTARKQKDIIKLNCVNDKLLQLKQLLNIADAARNNLTEAITLQNEPERYHQYGQITIAHEKGAVARDEAEACIGEELIFVGPTEVQVDEPDVVDDPTEDDPFNFDLDELEPPAYASPFM